jgi:hypothetical protein
MIEVAKVALQNKAVSKIAVRTVTRAKVFFFTD